MIDKLTDDEIANWAGGRPTNPTTEQGVRMALEIQELRAAQANGPDVQSGPSHEEPLGPSAGTPKVAEPDEYVKRLHASIERERGLVVTLDLRAIEGLVEARRCIDQHCEIEDVHHARALIELDRLLGIPRRQPTATEQCMIDRSRMRKDVGEP